LKNYPKEKSLELIIITQVINGNGAFPNDIKLLNDKNVAIRRNDKSSFGTNPKLLKYCVGIKEKGTKIDPGKGMMVQSMIVV
jgi:hypothetical protein